MKAILVVFLTVNLLGCSDQPTRYPISGKVLIDGEPLAMGSISFVPESGRPVTSAIMSDGSFELREHSLSSSHLSKGVAPGHYRIGVRAATVISEATDEVEWHVPSKYADFRTSGILVEIDGPKSDLVLDLTSEIDSHESSETEVHSVDTGEEKSPLEQESFE